MHVHVIRASSRHQLLANAQRDVGPEALILSVRQEHRNDGTGMEWEAVVAKDEGARSSQGSSQRRRSTPRSQPKPESRNSKPQTSQRNRETHPLRSTANKATRAYNDHRPKTQSGPEPTPNRSRKQQTNTRPPISSASSIEALRKDIAEHVRGGLLAEAPPAPELLYMARRLAHIENDLLARVMGNQGLAPRCLPILKRLHAAGYPESEALHILDTAQKSFDNSGMNLLDADTTQLIGEVRRIIANKIKVASLHNRSKPGMEIFVGGSGVGKTGLAAKLAADLCLGGANRPVLGVLQPRRAMGIAMVRRYAEHLGIDFVRVSESRQLGELAELSNHRHVILDSSGVSPLDGSGLRQLRRLLRRVPRAEIHAVVPATHGIQDVEMALDAFINVGATRISATKLDEAPFVGRIVAAAARSRLPIGYLSRGTRIPDDLVRPKIDSLLNAIFHHQPIATV